MKQKEITGKDILSLGVKPGQMVGALLKKAKELENPNSSKESILAQIKENLKDLIKSLDSEVGKLELRSKPLNISTAIECSTQEEEENLELSIQKMSELSLCPIVEAASLMPDTCPSGMEFGSIPVGGAIQTNNEVIPAAHSSDLCCSMMATIFESTYSHKNILDVMEKSTHFGPSPQKINPEIWHDVLNEEVWENPFLKNLKEIAHKNLATQGDGNHFFYLGTIQDIPKLTKNLEKEGHYKISKALSDSKLQSASILVTHHGSRHLGAQIYKRGIDKAIEETKKIAKNIPKNLAWLNLNTDIGRSYWEAIEYAQRWTIANHDLIHSKTLDLLQTNPITSFTNAHNFVWKHKNKILHGKGATPAWNNPDGSKSLGIIPLNMASEILVTLGNNNANFLSFSPHGAGRNKSRSKTMSKYIDPITKKIDRRLMEEDFLRSTPNLDIRWASKKMDISESPIAYKNKEDIKKQIKKFCLADIICQTSPKGCIMAGEFPSPWKEKKKRPITPLNTNDFINL